MTDNDPFEQARRAFEEGLAALQGGQPSRAESALRQSLQWLPGRPSTLNALGVAVLRQGRAAEALPLFDQALAADSGLAQAHGHRAETLSALGRFDDALLALDRAPAADPATLWHRAAALNALGRHPQALAALNTLRAHQPGHAAPWLELGKTHQSLGQTAQAINAYRQALTLAPTLAQAWSLLGQLFNDTGDKAQAEHCLEQAMAHGADPELHGWMLAALRGGPAPAHPPAAYVKALFDGYAHGFEQHLSQTLKYDAPKRLAQMVAGTGVGLPVQALDLGCGSGLCALALREQGIGVAATDGVDLSPTMLGHARSTGLYRHLHATDVAQHMAACDDRYDLLLAADVFIYVGALGPVFSGARRVLNVGGRFALCVEAASPAEALGPGFALRSSLRYSHSTAYVLGLAAQHGFTLLAQEDAPLRQDQGRAVQGHYFVLAANSGAQRVV